MCQEIPLVFVPTDAQEQSLNVRLEYLDDPNGNFTIEQVLGRASLFKTFDPSIHNFDYDKKVLWIRFSVDLTHYKEPYWFLIQNYEHVTDINLYSQTASGMEVQHWSEQAPVGNNIFKNTRTPMFKVPKPYVLPAIYYMRYAPHGHWLSVDLSWATVNGVIERNNTTQMVFGLFFGSLFIMWFYNFVLFLYLRDRVYFYYLYYLASFIGYFLYRNGFAPLIVQLTPFKERLFTLCAFTAVHGMILFARQFLTLKKSIRWIDNYLRFGHWAFVAGGILVFILPLGRPIQLISWLIMAFVPAMLVAGILRCRQKYEPAYMYTIGWVVFGLALFINAMRQVGFVPTNLFTVYLMQFGAVLEAVFFALALAYRIKLLDQATTAAKNSFLAMISHELGTPLQSIISSVELLLSRGEEQGKNSDVWRRLQSATEHLEMQMKDITDYARLGTGRIRLRKTSFNPSEIISEIVEYTRQMAHQKGLSYETEIEDTKFFIYSDALRIQQIINNLIINAIKYTDNGFVKVRLRYIEEKYPCLLIQVEDSGLGIDKNQIPKAFQPFTQLEEETSSRKHTGIGMGLAIVQQLVSLLHGSINVDSVVGKGTKFEVRIPFEKSEGNVVVDIDSGEESKGKRILVVDDTEDVRISLRKIILQLDYVCDVSVSGRDAIEQTKHHQYAVILLDIGMPDIDGFSVATEIRNSFGPNKSTPIIWIGANVPRLFSSDQRRLFNHFLAKPIRKENLRETLQKILD